MPQVVLMSKCGDEQMLICKCYNYNYICMHIVLHHARCNFLLRLGLHTANHAQCSMIGPYRFTELHCNWPWMMSCSNAYDIDVLQANIVTSAAVYIQGGVLIVWQDVRVTLMQSFTDMVT